MKRPSKFLIIGISVAFFCYILELMEDEIICLIIGGVVMVVTLVLELVKISQNLLDIVYELFSVFAAIGYISIFCNLIVDFITFLSFYFNIDKIILGALLLSAGNTVGDFFGNGALAKTGEHVMGAMSSYSG